MKAAKLFIAALLVSGAIAAQEVEYLPLLPPVEPEGDCSWVGNVGTCVRANLSIWRCHRIGSGYLCIHVPAA